MSHDSAVYDLVRAVDPRVTASKPTYSAEVSGSANSMVSYAANTQSTSALGFQISTPSQSVVLQRGVMVTATMVVNCTVTTTPQAVGAPIAVFGRDLAFRPFPLNSAVATWTVVMGSATVTSQSTSLNDLLACCNTKQSRKGRLAPSALARYASWNAAAGTLSALGSYADTSDGDMSSLGAFPAYYTGPTGVALSGNGNYTGSNGTVVTYVAGVPVASAASNGGAVNIYVAINTIEPLLCSPFSWQSDEARYTEGLYNLANINVQGQLASAAQARLIQNAPIASGCTVTSQTLAFLQSSTLWAEYLTPNLQTPLAPKCIVPMSQVLSFPQTVQQTLAPGASATLAFSNISVGSVPDAILVSVRPQTTDAGGMPADAADYCLPIQSFAQMQFANQSGLLSNFPTWAIWNESVAAGLKCDYLQYAGTSQSGGVLTAMAGGPSVLRPGVTFPLPLGQSQGCAGSYQLSFSVTVQNTTGYTITNPVITCTILSTSFFVASPESTQIVNVALSEADLLKAPHGLSRYDTARLVGGGFWSSLGGHALRLLKGLLGHRGGEDAISASDGPRVGSVAHALAMAAKKGSGGGGVGVSGSGVGISGSGVGRGRGSIAERLAMA